MGWLGFKAVMMTLRFVLTVSAVYLGVVTIGASSELDDNIGELAYVASSLVCCAATLVLAWRVI